MQTILSTLSALADPVGFLWGILLFAALGALWSRRWSLLVFSAALLVFLQVTAGSNLARLLIGRLEAPYDPRLNPLPSRVDAVVMLGGTLDFGPREILGINLGEPADRILTAVELVRQGRAPRLVLSSAPYLRDGELRGDSELIAVWLERWGVSRGEVTRLPLGRNTREEAVETAAMAARHGWDQILVVTSAYHLRRAEATFRRAGVTNVVPVGCDFMGPEAPGEPWKLTGIPRVRPLVVLNYWIHEQMGWWYYGFRDWR